MDNKLTAKIRMYRMHELGDCFFLSFEHEDKKAHVLIDCGSFRNSNTSAKKFKEITKNIRTELENKPIDLVVATHQHNDQMSGFEYGKSDFENMGIKQVFLSWLDDESDSLALDIAEKHNKIVKQLAHIKGVLNQKEYEDIETVRFALEEVVDERSFSQDNSFTGKATQFLKKIGDQDVRYMSPGEIVEIPGFPKDLVRIHVLGPPRNYKSIRSKNPRKGESYDPHLNNILFSIDELTNALVKESGDFNFPFNEKYKEYPEEEKASERTIEQAVNYKQKEHWRQVNNDWLGIAQKFALHLNTYTNNTSLVLAFELVKSGKVLLFVGDAQAGNWRSWDTIEWKGEDPLTMDALYRNTVFYKVGHHGSHNATAKKAMDQMVNKDLVAFIPVNKKDPNLKKAKPWRMPAKNLYKELKKKTKGRIARMDEGKIRTSKDNWEKDSLKVNPLYVEYTLKDE